MTDRIDATTAAICTWPSCGHTAKGQCGLTMSVATIAPRPDNADLIRRMKEEAEQREPVTTDWRQGDPVAALLREAVKAVEPFANAADRVDYYDGEHYDGALYASRSGDVLVELLDGRDGERLTVANLRAVREVLAALRAKLEARHD